MPREPATRAPAKEFESAEPKSWPRRVGWFIGLWLASVTVLGVVALLIRFWLNP